MLYIVRQEPKTKWRNAYVSTVAIIEASTAKAALASAMEINDEGDGFSSHHDFKRPTVEPLKLATAYRV